MFNLTRGWAVAFVGANGVPTYSIQLTNPNHHPVRDRGYLPVWDINDWTFLNRREDLLLRTNITEERYAQLKLELEALTAKSS